jgi:hypothetical protein
MNEYNQYSDDINNGIIFNGNKKYSDLKDTKFNDYLLFDNKKYYSSINKDFSEYSFPEDYLDSSFEELCKVGEYSLKQQQKFAGRIFNNHVDNKGLLIYHGLGSGKTQTSIVISEAFKHKSIDSVIIPNRAAAYVLIVVPASLTEQYFNELIGNYYNKKVNSASGEILIFGKKQYYLNADIIDSLNKQYSSLEKLKQQLINLKNKGEYSEINEVENKITQINNAIRVLKDQGSKNVKKVYEIISHDTFLNGLFKGREFKEEKYLNRLRINNGLLVIDEAHRLVSAIGTNYRKLLFALKFHSANLFRVVLLTGSPIYDKPYEFGLLMNLLRPRISFPDGPDAFNKYFIENDSFINKDLFKMMCSGYVSYFKGGNPNAYPYKRIIIYKHYMGDYQYSKYKQALINEVDRDKELTKDLGNSYDDFMYKIGNNNNNNEDSISVYNNARLYCNIAFPESKEQYDYKGTKQTRRKAFTKNTMNNFKKILTNINLEDYSSKFNNIVNLITLSEGPVFIYSNYVNYGVEPMGIILSKLLNYSAFTGTPGNNTYFVWKGDTDKLLIESAKKIFNSESNSDGSRLRVLLGTQTTMEGVDFKRVRQVHILDPWWNDSRIQQIMARAVRLCSHSGLPESKRVTDIFIHLSSLGNNIPYSKVKLKDSRVLNSNLEKNKQGLYREVRLKIINNSLNDVRETNNYFSEDQIDSIESLGDPELFGIIGSWKGLSSESVEEYMYSRSMKKLKLNRQFDDVIKSIAVDCDINKNGNILRLEEEYSPLKNNNNLWELKYQNYSSGEYYVQKGVNNVFNIQQILNNIKPDSFEFENILTKKVITTNKYLIIKENIECDSGKVDYSFDKVPESLKKITINNSLIPRLMNTDLRIIKNYLLKILNTDNNLSSKLYSFIKQSEYSEKESLIKKIIALGIGDANTPWELTDINQLKAIYSTHKNPEQ